MNTAPGLGDPGCLSSTISTDATTLDLRKKRSLRAMYDCAARLATAEQLNGMSMKVFAAEVGVAVNTIKRNGFDYVSDVAESLIEHPEAVDIPLTPAAIEHLRVVGRKSAARTRKKAAHRLQQIAVDARGRIHDGREDPVSAIRRLEHEHERAAREFAAESAVLAELSNVIAELHLDYAAIDSIGEPFGRAYTWADTGIQEFERDSRSRNFTLGVKLTQNGLKAIRGLIGQVNRRLPADPSVHDVREARQASLPHLSRVALLMAREQRYCKKLNNPVGAACAQFHRRRADALSVGGEVGERAEIDAVFEMATALRRAGTPIPDEVLQSFLPRLCAMQVAYADKLSAREHTELDTIRRVLVDAIDGEASKTMKRAVQALFALAEIDLGTREAAFERPPEHLADLIVVTSFGAIGRVLVADHLIRAAETAGTPGALYKQTDLGTIGEHEFRRAALYWYRNAPANMNVSGVSSKLSQRARDSLHFCALKSDSAPGRWSFLDDRSDGLNIYMLQQLTARTVTGKPPTQKQAETLLDELEPFLTVLRSISNRRAIDPVLR